MNAVLIGVAAYVALQFAIGLWVARRISSESDFINAGRSIGPFLGAFTVFATWFGAEAIVGAAGEVYREGLVGATIDPFGYAAGLIVAGLVLAVPLWTRGYLTFADFFRDRYSATVEQLAVLMILPGTIIWAGIQIRAFGQVMGAASDLPIVASILVAAVLVVAYTALGGLLADAITDMVQGIAIIAGLIVLFFLIINDAGGLGPSLDRVPRERLAPVSSDLTIFQQIEQWAIPIFGTLVSIELISRMLAGRSARVARNACIYGGLLYLAVGLLPVYFGLVGPELVPGLVDGEQVVPKLAALYLPKILYVIFVGAMISAILSTVDSALLAAGAILSHNTIQRVAPGLDERFKLILTRVTVALLGAVATTVALQSDSIHDMIEVASAIGSAGLVVVLCFGLFTRIGAAPSAIAALVTGTGIWLAGTHIFALSTPYLAGVAGAAMAYLMFAPIGLVCSSASKT